MKPKIPPRQEWENIPSEDLFLLLEKRTLWSLKWWGIWILTGILAMIISLIFIIKNFYFVDIWKLTFGAGIAISTFGLILWQIKKHYDLNLHIEERKILTENRILKLLGEKLERGL